MKVRLGVCIATLMLTSAASLVLAQFEIAWQTIDCGGVMSSTGGSFTLDGTIGQPDAGSLANPLTGGSFQLVGGFWAISATGCACRGDVNGDNLKDGRDVQQFVGCMIQGTNCSCADMDGSGSATVADVPLFVGALMAGATCP